MIPEPVRNTGPHSKVIRTFRGVTCTFKFQGSDRESATDTPILFWSPSWRLAKKKSLHRFSPSVPLSPLIYLPPHFPHTVCDLFYSEPLVRMSPTIIRYYGPVEFE